MKRSHVLRPPNTSRHAKMQLSAAQTQISRCCCSRRQAFTAAHSAFARRSAVYRDASRCSAAPAALLGPSAERSQPRSSSRVTHICRAAVATAEPGKTTLGFCGIGIMGLPMAQNLIKAGYKVVVWNRSADKCEPLKAAGAEVASSPADVARRSDITFAMLADPAAAWEVAAGPDGVAAGMSAGKGYVDVSTIDPETSRKVAAAVRAKGALFLEAPVSGSKGPAEQGQLIFLTAGDEALYTAASPPLDVMGKAKFFLGAEGAGANMKLVVNAVMGAMMASFAEGMSLADEMGLKKQDLIDVIALGAISAPMFALKGPAMAKASYPPAFPLKHQQKDLRLVLAEADAVGVPLPVISAANEQYIRARAQGYGDADFSAVLEAVAPQEKELSA